MDALLNNCKIAQRELNKLGGEQRNDLLKKIHDGILNNIPLILSANELDVEAAKTTLKNPVMIDRLILTEDRIKAIASSILEITLLPDYVGETIEEFTGKAGIKIKKIRVPFGVICAIFESRPNVAVDISALCIKSGNAVVLKGGKEAINTNKCLVSVMRKAIEKTINPDIITLIESVDRSTTDELITKSEYIDLLIPRGSKSLIKYVVSNAKVPFIETGAGNCHLYVNEHANLDMAIKIAINAKYQRPSVCNAVEKILVDENIKDTFLPRLYDEFKKLNIEMRGCEETAKIIDVVPATEEDYYTEYNDYIVAIKVVKDIDEAIEHINKYSTKHSEAIITENAICRDKFFNEIDSACVYHNASTRFTDGNEFSFGAEIGISTAKLHARGPMGIREITTYKYVIEGNGEVRK